MSKFDYCGYDRKKLKALCGNAGVRCGWARWVNWPPEVYSFGRHIRDYADYPAFLPLHIYSDHGAGPYYDGIPPHELESGAYCQFYHSPDKVRDFKALSARPCYTMFSPFVHYRRKHGITPAIDARGTLVFHSHSTPGFDMEMDYDRYVAQLRELPEKYKPICVSLHMHDIEKGVHEIFIRNGFPVYTAGNARDYRFAERFYEILRHFRYTSSSSLGSYVHYAEEMGIPFFLHGETPHFVNVSDRNYTVGDYDLAGMPLYLEGRNLFLDRESGITAEQKKYIEYHLGIHDCVSPEEMHRLLWEAYRAQGNPLLDLWFLFGPWRYLKMAWHYLRNR